MSYDEPILLSAAVWRSRYDPDMMGLRNRPSSCGVSTTQAVSASHSVDKDNSNELKAKHPEAISYWIVRQPTVPRLWMNHNNEVLLHC